jgi:hypothetical protein
MQLTTGIGLRRPRDVIILLAVASCGGDGHANIDAATEIDGRPARQRYLGQHARLPHPLRARGIERGRGGS